MNHATRGRLLAATALSALIVSGSAGTAFADGHGGGDHHRHGQASCTISSDAQQAILDQVGQLNDELAGVAPSKPAVADLKAGAAEVSFQARGQHLSAAQRRAKSVQVRSLAVNLKHAGSAEERIGLRAQIGAEAGELANARVTGTQQAALRTQAAQLQADVRPQRLLGQARAAVEHQVHSLLRQLGCGDSSDDNCTSLNDGNSGAPGLNDGNGSSLNDGNGSGLNDGNGAPSLNDGNGSTINDGNSSTCSGGDDDNCTSLNDGNGGAPGLNDGNGSTLNDGNGSGLNDGNGSTINDGNSAGTPQQTCSGDDDHGHHHGGHGHGEDGGGDSGNDD